MTNAALAIQNWVKIFNEEPEVPLNEVGQTPDKTKLQTYFGMSLNPCTEPQRLKLFWSILGDCIEDRKEFTFQCENEDEADELKKLTWTLVFQINDIWEVYLDDLVVKANPPKE
jgi:hypothetical protein